MSTTQQKAPPVRPARTTLPVLRLVYSGDHVVLPAARLAPGRGATPVGREVKGGIALPDDPRASRHHATLHAGVTGTLRVVDEKSRNGTFVNGKRVESVAETDHCCRRFCLVDGWLRERGLQREGKVGSAEARLCESRAVVAAALEHLAEDPLIFLCPSEEGCEECDAARSSVPAR